jgi:hypothetical protein
LFNIFNNTQIFHCCVQKTASQWFRFILGQDEILSSKNLKYSYPYDENFDRSDNIFTSKSYKEFPKNSLISPLYIDHSTFTKIPKPKDYRAFFVTRDPRDILVSWYFSTKFSHGKDGYLNKYISDLTQINDIEEGLLYSVDALDEFGLWKTINSWQNSYNPKYEKIVRFEDLTGKNQLEHWTDLLTFLELPVDQSKLASVLSTYNFEYWTKGRKKGEEDQSSHMRKGISGDWKNYFSPQLEKIFEDRFVHLL